MAYENPKQVRELIRGQELVRPTCGLAPGYAQANLVILPRELGFDFLLFCQRNPKPCPVLEVLEPGQYTPAFTAPGADIRTDLPLYRIYRNGELIGEGKDIMNHWQDELVTFLIGCSFSFESALLRAGIPLRHLETGSNVPMFVTNRQTAPAGVFWGPLVVSMRPIPRELVIRATQVTSRFPSVHGAPVHIGDPGQIGVDDLARPDYGDPVDIKANEVPVFWACGVTPQAVAVKSKPPLMITHAPGHMFITDIRDEELSVF
jgi:uncharacterized protein YcsI (UPF0317 family)